MPKGTHIIMTDDIAQRVSDYGYYRGGMKLSTACSALVAVGLNPELGKNPAHQLALQFLTQGPQGVIVPNAERRTRFHVMMDDDTRKRFEAFQKHSGDTNVSRVVTQLTMIGLTTRPDVLALQKHLMADKKLQS